MNNLNFNDFLECVDEKGLIWNFTNTAQVLIKRNKDNFSVSIGSFKVGDFGLSPNYQGFGNRKIYFSRSFARLTRTHHDSFSQAFHQLILDHFR